MSEVTSVNGQTGVVVLTAADVSAVAESEAGQPSGVATLNGSGELTAAQLPGSVVSSSTKEHGEAEGEQTPNLAEGHVHTYTAKGAFALQKPTNWPTGTTYAQVVVTQNSAGGHAITTPGLVWIGGPEPKWKTEANAVNVISLVSFDGGLHWFGEASPEGPTGAQGPEGFYPSKLKLPSKILTYKTTGSSSSEERQALAESLPREVANANLVLTSGTSIFAAIPAPAKKVCRGLGFWVQEKEGTAANRTHLWVALLNAAGEVVAVSEDFTSSANTPVFAASFVALPFAATYETPAEELLRGIVCEVMSSTNPLTVITREGNAVENAAPALCGTAGAGLTTPPALKASPALTGVAKYPYMVIV